MIFIGDLVLYASPNQPFLPTTDSHIVIILQRSDLAASMFGSFSRS